MEWRGDFGDRGDDMAAIQIILIKLICMNFVGKFNHETKNLTYKVMMNEGVQKL